MNLDHAKEQERLLAKQAALGALSPTLYRAWEKCKTITRVPCHQNKIFSVWSFDQNAEPVVHGGLTVKKIGVDSYSGTTASIEIDTGIESGHYLVSHTPINLIAGRLFCYAPFVNTVTYLKSKNSDKPITRLSLCFKQEAGNLDTTPGELRLTPISEFRATYPKFKGLYL